MQFLKPASVRSWKNPEKIIPSRLKEEALENNEVQ
jgi:hypothetical protein